MGREEFLAKAVGFAVRLAEDYGCDELVMGEDRKKGVWGEDFTAFLERTVGECTRELTWTGGDHDESREFASERHERQVQFRFRFANPCVSVSLGHNMTYAELEFSDSRIDDGEYVHTGEFDLREVRSWGRRDGGMGLLYAMRDKCAETIGL